jgi:hypothetical protein
LQKLYKIGEEAKEKCSARLYSKLTRQKLNLLPGRTSRCMEEVH